MWKLRRYGLDHIDSSFYFRESTAPPGCEIDDEDSWHTANPALGDFLHIDALRGNLRTSRESSFRRYRLGQWVGRDDAWLPDVGPEFDCVGPPPVPVRGKHRSPQRHNDGRTTRSLGSAAMQ